MDERTMLEMADVSNHHYEGGGNPLLSGMTPKQRADTLSSPWYAFWKWTGALDEKMPIQLAAEKAAAQHLGKKVPVTTVQAQQRREELNKMQTKINPESSNLSPGEWDWFDSVETKKKEEEEAKKRAEETAKQLKAACVKQGGAYDEATKLCVKSQFPEIPKWTPWAVAGGLGVLILILAARR